MQIPGFAQGTSFSSVSDVATTNEFGQVVFSAAYSTGEISKSGIWATDIAGLPKPVIQIGDVIEVAPNDLRTVNSIKGRSIEENAFDRRIVTINDRGQIAFAVSFTDGTKGAFVSDAVAVTPGDFNRDGVVDAADLGAWSAGFASAGAGLPADGDGDNDVDGGDFLLWQRNVTASSSLTEVETVPEPSTAVLAIAAAVACMHVRRSSAA